MNKSIELTQSQIKALESGATMFIFPIDNRIFECVECSGGASWDCEKTIIKELSTIQKGDKDIFVQEDFRFNEYGDYEYKTGLNTKVTSHLNINQWQKASKMTKEQSRYSFNECIDAKAIRVQEINIKDIPKIQTEMWMFDDWYNQQMKEQNINRTYEDNDYVFLVEFA